MKEMQCSFGEIKSRALHDNEMRGPSPEAILRLQCLDHRLEGMLGDAAGHTTTVPSAGSPWHARTCRGNASVRPLLGEVRRRSGRRGGERGRVTSERGDE